MTDRVKLHLGTVHYSLLFCIVRSLHKHSWRTVGAQLYEAHTISSVAILPMEAANRFIVVYMRSIPDRLSKMHAPKSLMNHCRSFWDMVMILSQVYLPTKVANSTIMDHWSRIGPLLSEMEGLKSLMLRWRSFLGHSEDVVESIFA